MKICKTMVVDSFIHLTKTTTNKFWGVLAIINAIKTPVKENVTYEIKISSIMSFLDRLFNLNPHYKHDYSNEVIYVKFSKFWKEKIKDLILKESNKPGILEAAVFYYKFYNYKLDLNSSRIADDFIKECKLDVNKLIFLFDNNIKTDIQLENYKIEDFVEALEEKLKIKRKENYHLSIESPFFIQSKPSELKRAPFIQTLYSGDRIKELLLVSDTNLEELYPVSDSSHEYLKTVNVVKIIDFAKEINIVDLRYNITLISRFIASLIAKPFVILTGLSGSGKTKLAQAFAMWMCENKEQYCIVPVGADWTNREPLIGFPNALKDKEYVKPDNGVLDLIISANNDRTKPHFLILDEMNLSHVERYFADFLSVMESGNEILLHSGEENWDNVPPRLGFPDNLFILGTVNIDETTYMFSPKVLDRANVIEFRVTDEEMETYLNNAGPVSLEKLSGAGAGMAGDFLAIARDKSIKTKYRDNIHETMMLFFHELKKTGAEFGYRTASEILRFAAVVNKIEPDWSERDILDAAIMQKLLPKVHGSRKKLEPVLKTLGMLCLEKDQNFDDYVKDDAEINYSDSSEIKYPLSLEKIVRMYKNLLSNGFTSFAEA